MFYPKLAAGNIRKNRGIYIPFIAASSVTFAMYYIICSLSRNEGLLNLSFGAAAVTSVLNFGSYVVAVFAVIFLFYTNSFLIKRRRKEFAIYNILGMEKKHLSIVMTFEMLFALLLIFLTGAPLGILLDKLMYLILANILSIEITLGFYISFASLASAAVLFAGIFLLILLNSIRSVHTSKPIELLRSSSSGEKEPKANWVVALLGLVCLVSGYAIALAVKDPIQALMLFFVAVILVIIGTYALFSSVSVVVLKLLRKNKRYYYKTKHFISISGMIYRMKQNAVGIGNICILSTMVLVTVSSTLSLVAGLNDIVETQCPYDIMAECSSSDSSDREGSDRIVSESLEQSGMEITDSVKYSYAYFSQRAEDGGDPSKTFDYILWLLPLDDYNRLTNQSFSLDDGEILLFANNTEDLSETFDIFENSYHIREIIDEYLPQMNGFDMSNQWVSVRLAVLKDEDEIFEILERYNDSQEQTHSMHTVYGFDFSGTDELKESFRGSLNYSLSSGGVDYTVDSKAESRRGALIIYGGLLFIGVFLGTLFLIATAVIMYYKQISEGFEDRRRFEIMQKVGLSRTQVKKSINSQILTVFFLPLGVACVHLAFAFPIIRRILSVMYLTNTRLYALCTVGCVLAFALIYAAIYLLTARSYYKIVKR